MLYRKKAKRLFLGAICSTLITLSTVPVYALKDISKPAQTPVELEKIGVESWESWKEGNGGEYSDWIGVYYAEGTGLELQITCQRLRGSGGFTVDENGNPYILMQLNDYGSGQTLIYGDINEIEENQYSTLDSNITLTKTGKGKIQVEFSQDQINSWNADNMYLYMDLTSAEFTDVEMLEKDPAENNWEGTYLDDSNEVSSDTSTLYAFKQLYGTSDYFCYMTFLQYGDETGSGYYFYTEKGDKLVHAQMPGVVSSEVTYECFEKDDSGALCRPISTIPESQIDQPLNMNDLEGRYEQLSNHPQWEDDVDGYFK